MSHSSHPYSMRLAIIRPWRSRWFNAKDFSKLLKEDVRLRDFLAIRLKGTLVDGIEIERTNAALNIIIRTARPGLIIGRGGEGITKLQTEVAVFLQKHRSAGKNSAVDAKKDIKKEQKPPTLKLTVEEVKIPEAHAQIMVEQIAMDLEKRMPFRRVMKQTLGKIMNAKEVKGVKLSLSGRLDGAEMARYEWLKDGQVPLQTLRADVDYAKGRAHLPYGDLGIKVWIYRGEIFNHYAIPKKSKI
ncbi:MAG: 30S ribosomal protein S3 [bacterium]|nr:30S ribosomal protein S3 [bacterium]